MRLVLYGLSGKVQAAYDFKAGETFDIDHRPVFTVTRIALELVDVQEKLDV